MRSFIAKISFLALFTFIGLQLSAQAPSRTAEGNISQVSGQEVTVNMTEELAIQVGDYVALNKEVTTNGSTGFVTVGGYEVASINGSSVTLTAKDTKDTKDGGGEKVSHITPGMKVNLNLPTGLR